MKEYENKTVSVPKRVKKTYAFLPSVAELIETILKKKVSGVGLHLEAGA